MLPSRGNAFCTLSGRGPHRAAGRVLGGERRELSTKDPAEPVSRRVRPRWPRPGVAGGGACRRGSAARSPTRCSSSPPRRGRLPFRGSGGLRHRAGLLAHARFCPAQPAVPPWIAARRSGAVAGDRGGPARCGRDRLPGAVRPANRHRHLRRVHGPHGAGPGPAAPAVPAAALRILVLALRLRPCCRGELRPGLAGSHAPRWLPGIRRRRPRQRPGAPRRWRRTRRTTNWPARVSWRGRPARRADRRRGRTRSPAGSSR